MLRIIAFFKKIFNVFEDDMVKDYKRNYNSSYY